MSQLRYARRTHAAAVQALRCSGLAAFLCSAAIASLLAPRVHAEMTGCDASGAAGYVCGIPSAEDLVRVPGTPWLIASGYAGPDALNLINTADKSWRALFPSPLAALDFDEQRFDRCPGPPSEGGLTTHGLHIGALKNGHATLHAVGHGEREAIEVFDVAVGAEGAPPTVTWLGCIPTPDEQEANSVVALADGSLLATIPLETGREFAEAMAGKSTGAVYAWSAQSGEWARLPESAVPYANGIEVSTDESVVYVASSGLANVTAYRNTRPLQALWSTETLPVAPDNLHRDASGMLITAGLYLEYAACDPYDEAGNFDLALFGACPRPYAVIAVDPDSAEVSVLADVAADSSFSNITMAVNVDGTLWIGTFGGDRVAYRPLE